MCVCVYVILGYRGMCVCVILGYGCVCDVRVWGVCVMLGYRGVCVFGCDVRVLGCVCVCV